MEPITVSISIEADVRKTWDYWTSPDHITGWNFASEDWKCPSAINNLTPGGKFSWRMEAKDGSMAFDYSGVYESIDFLRTIRKKLDDARKVEISFSEYNGRTEVVVTYEPDENDPDLQRQGWQAILNNFKKYVESN